MAEQPKTIKLPIPRLATTAYTRKVRKRKTDEEKNYLKKEDDRARNKTRINIGVAYHRWRELRDSKRFKLDADLATFLLDSYERSLAASKLSKGKPLQVTTQAVSRVGSSTGTDSAHFESPTTKTSLKEEEQETALSIQEPVGNDAASQLSENKENRDIDEDEEFSASSSVEDGRGLVDLGSSSELIVDEECILQLLKLCRECNKQCSIRKRITGLKLVVYQSCRFCPSSFKWTNLPDDDDGDNKDCSDLQVNGKNTVHKQNGDVTEQ